MRVFCSQDIAAARAYREVRKGSRGIRSEINVKLSKLFSGPPSRTLKTEEIMGKVESERGKHYYSSLRIVVETDLLAFEIEGKSFQTFLPLGKRRFWGFKVEEPSRELSKELVENLQMVSSRLRVFISFKI